MDKERLLKKLEEFLDREAVNIRGFCKEVGISYMLWLYIKRGERSLTDDVAEKITKALKRYGVNLWIDIYLQNEKGEQFHILLYNEYDDEIDTILDQINESYGEYEFISEEQFNSNNLYELDIKDGRGKIIGRLSHDTNLIDDV